MIPSEFMMYYENRIEFIKQQERRADTISAMIAVTVANFSMNKKKGKQYKISDFIGKEKQTPEQMFEVVKRLNSRMKGAIQWQP